MLDLHELDRWARDLDRVADDVRAARRRLDGAVGGAQWRSTAAGRFRDDAAEHGVRLDRCAAELAEAATALRAHARAAEARAAALGDAAGDVLSAARAAAGSGVAAVTSAMGAAERAVRELQHAGDRLLDRARDAVT